MFHNGKTWYEALRSGIATLILVLSNAVVKPDYQEVVKVCNKHNIQELYLNSTATEDADLEELAGLSTVTTLALDGCRHVGDRGISALRNLINLEVLHLSCTAVTDITATSLPDFSG